MRSLIESELLVEGFQDEVGDGFPEEGASLVVVVDAVGGEQLRAVGDQGIEVVDEDSTFGHDSGGQTIACLDLCIPLGTESAFRIAPGGAAGPDEVRFGGEFGERAGVVAQGGFVSFVGEVLTVQAVVEVNQSVLVLPMAKRVSRSRAGSPTHLEVASRSTLALSWSWALTTPW